MALEGMFLGHFGEIELSDSQNLGDGCLVEKGDLYYQVYVQGVVIEGGIFLIA